MSLERRLMKKVVPEPNSGCWLWLGAITTKGYGQIRLDGTAGGRTGAHQASWIVANGPIPDGLFVCHKCDVRLCVNPEHLFLGTHQDNMDDMHRKSRHRVRRGQDRPHSKFKDADIPVIRGLLAAGWPQAEVAQRYGVAGTTINHIATGRTWTHVGGVAKATGGPPSLQEKSGLLAVISTAIEALESGRAEAAKEAASILKAALDRGRP